MNPMQQAVRDFHQKFGLTINETPTWPERKDRNLREDLIAEEHCELWEADDIKDVADALADLLYVVLGAAVTYGIDIEPVFWEVHRSNMTKVWPDGTVKKNESGKVIKPPTYSPANIEREIERQSNAQRP